MSSTRADALSDFAWAGCVITRPVTLPGLTRTALLPDLVITTSPCLTQLFPDIWTLSWTTDWLNQRATALHTFAIAEDRLPTLVPLADALFNAHRLLWPCYLADPDAARDLLAAAAPQQPDIAVLGLALHRAHVGSFLADLPSTPDQESTLLGLLAKRLPVPDGGVLLGYELLGFDSAASAPHSWLCNYLHEELWQRHGQQPGAHGLLAEYGVADAWAAEVTHEQLGEPGLWLPWALIDYTPLVRSSAGPSAS